MICYEYFAHSKFLVVRLDDVVSVDDFIGFIATINDEFKHDELDYILCDFRKSTFNFCATRVDEIVKYRTENTNFRAKYASVFLVDNVKQTTYTTLYNHFSQVQNFKLDVKVCVTIDKAAILLGLKNNPTELERMLQNLKRTFAHPVEARL